MLFVLRLWEYKPCLYLAVLMRLFSLDFHRAHPQYLFFLIH